MNFVGLGDDVPIENRLVTKSLESAQVKVEGHHFEIRKHLLEYDDVLNHQRQVIYGERRKTLTGADLRANIIVLVHKEIDSLLAKYLPGQESDGWNPAGFLGELGTIFQVPSDLNDEDKLALLGRDEIEQQLISDAEDLYERREVQMGEENTRTLERLLMLRTIDAHWVHHLTAMDNLRQGIGLRGYGQRDPLVAYRTEGSRMFQELLGRIQHDVVHSVYQVSLSPARVTRPSSNGPKESAVAAASGRQKEPVPAGGHKIGRNEPCPCGSGKKYKRCHGANG